MAALPMMNKPQLTASLVVSPMIELHDQDAKMISNDL
jgi:hypothetical protein